jgi:hypothetical protein
VNTTATNDPVLTIIGDASGTATFENLGNATLTLTIADNSHNHVESDITDLDKYTQAETDGFLNNKVNTSLLGVNNGVATLDEQGKILVAQLPNSVFDSLFFYDTVGAGTTELREAGLAAVADANTVGRSAIGYYWVATAAATLSGNPGGFGTVTVGGLLAESAGFTPREEGVAGGLGDNLETGDWFILVGITGLGTVGSPYGFTFAVVNNTYELASSSVDGIVRLSNTTTISSSTTGNQVVTQGVLGGLIGTAANTIAAGDDARFTDARTPLAHTHTKSEITDFAHTHAIADVTNLQTALDTVGQVAGQNTKLGLQALNVVTAGNRLNVAIGYQTLFTNTTGSNNTALGHRTLFNNVEGSDNTALGLSALGANSSGSSNTALGLNSGRYIADGSTNNFTGSNSVFVGSSTKALANGQTNQIVIGHNATGIGSNTVTLGNDSIVTTALKGDVGIGTTTPSARLHINGVSLIFQTAQTSLKTYGSQAGLQIVSYQSVGGSPFTKTSDIVANADGPVPSQMRLFTKASGDTSASERMRITDGGNIGINQVTPTERLDVGGNIKASGSVTSATVSATTSVTTPSVVATSTVKIGSWTLSQNGTSGSLDFVVV